MASRSQVRQLTPAAETVLTTAGRLFYDRGINAVGVDTIAREAGVTKKTLYDQFGSKAALVVAYLERRDDHFRAWVTETIRAHDGDEKILAVFDALDTWMDAHSPKGCAFVHAHGELVGSPEHPAHEVIRAEKRWFQETFTTLVRSAGSASPQQTALQLVALLEGAKVVRSITGSPEAVTASRLAAATILRSSRGEDVPTE
ncbi:TetR/AcrR family transcriptional regulator [Corynebacterium kalidii]